MATSQNGYKAGDRSLIASYTVPGSAVKIPLRKGDVSVVLLDLLSWFHSNIEPLRQKDTGGYVNRVIRGSETTLSNHASGTAVDVRWQDHPLGAVGTFSKDQVAKIQARLKFYEGVIRWGGNYKGRKDEMHFEINAGLAAVKRVADKIRKPATGPKPGYPNVPIHISGAHDVKEGHRGTDVVDIQRKVGKVVADGVFGPKTTVAVKRWQKDHKLGADGIVGDQTWKSLGY